MLARRYHTGQQRIHFHVMGKAEDHLIHDLVPPNGAGDEDEIRVGRPLADEMIRIEATDLGAADTPSHGGDVVEVWLSHHSPHGRVNIMIDELMLHVLFEDGREIRTVVIDIRHAPSAL
jgi:hypothetical protein